MTGNGRKTDQRQIWEVKELNQYLTCNIYTTNFWEIFSLFETSKIHRKGIK